jgi:hypothetical protein
MEGKVDRNNHYSPVDLLCDMIQKFNSFLCLTTVWALLMVLHINYCILSLICSVLFMLCQGASAAVNATILLQIFLNPKGLVYFYFVIPIPAALFVRIFSLFQKISTMHLVSQKSE